MLPSSVLPSARTLLVGRVVGLSAAELRESRLTADAEWKRYAIDAPPVAGLLGDDGCRDTCQRRGQHNCQERRQRSAKMNREHGPA